MSQELAGHGMVARCDLFDRVRVRGHQQPVRVFTVPEHPDDGSEQFSRAVGLYLKGDFESAKKVFSKLQGPLAGYLGGRCYQLLRRKERWLGYFSWEVK